MEFHHVALIHAGDYESGYVGRHPFSISLFAVL